MPLRSRIRSCACASACQCQPNKWHTSERKADAKARLIRRRQPQVRQVHGRERRAGAAAGHEGVQTAGERALRRRVRAERRAAAVGRRKRRIARAAMEGAEELRAGLLPVRVGCAQARRQRRQRDCGRQHQRRAAAHPAAQRRRPRAQRRPPRAASLARRRGARAGLASQATRVARQRCAAAQRARNSTPPRTRQLPQLPLVRLGSAAQEGVSEARRRVGGARARGAVRRAAGAAHELAQGHAGGAAAPRRARGGAQQPPGVCWRKFVAVAKPRCNRCPAACTRHARASPRLRAICSAAHRSARRGVRAVTRQQRQQALPAKSAPTTARDADCTICPAPLLAGPVGITHVAPSNARVLAAATPTRRRAPPYCLGGAALLGRAAPSSPALAAWAARGPGRTRCCCWW